MIRKAEVSKATYAADTTGDERPADVHKVFTDDYHNKNGEANQWLKAVQLVLRVIKQRTYRPLRPISTMNVNTVYQKDTNLLTSRRKDTPPPVEGHAPSQNPIFVDRGANYFVQSPMPTQVSYEEFFQ